MGSDSQSLRIDHVCPLPPPRPAACYPPLVSSPPTLVPRIPYPQFVPLGSDVGSEVRWVHRAQVPERAAWSAMRWRRAGAGPASTLTVTVRPGWAFSLWRAKRWSRASCSCDVRRRAPLARGVWRSRAAVTLCTARTTGRPLLRCWAALRRPLAIATWWATCQVWRVAWHAGLLGPWVAVVAIAPPPAASMRAPWPVPHLRRCLQRRCRWPTQAALWVAACPWQQGVEWLFLRSSQSLKLATCPNLHTPSHWQ